MKQLFQELDLIESIEIQNHNVINATSRVSQQELHTKLHKTQLDTLLEESLASKQPFWLRFSRYNDAIIDAMNKPKGF